MHLEFLLKYENETCICIVATQWQYFNSVMFYLHVRMDISVATPPIRNTPEETTELETPNLGSDGGSPVGSTGAKEAQIVSRVDFELDIKVAIESGKCVLHPKLDPEKESDADTRR